MYLAAPNSLTYLNRRYIMTKSAKPQLEISGKALSIKGYSVEIYASIQDVSPVWEGAAPINDLFLQRSYLRLLEKHPPEGMQFCYLVFYREKRPVGVALGQIQHFRADQSINLEEDKKSNGPCFFTAFANYLRGLFAKQVEFKTLICGNLLLTGEHGCYFDPEQVERERGFVLLEEGLTYASEWLLANKVNVMATLVKEFYPGIQKYANGLTDKNYHEVCIQPNMVLTIRPHWTSFDDYLEDLTSKYRVRTRRALKKKQDLEFRELSLEEIRANLDRLYELYLGIAENSGFNVISLNREYLAALKEQLPEKFRLYASYDKGKLIAYYTVIHNGKELEAHFLGFERDYNRSHQLYHNILYEILQHGIDLGVEKIIYARTALEIKSSIGAVPVDMYCYFRHRNSFSNRFLSPILDYLKPDDDWQQRHPFK